MKKSVLWELPYTPYKTREFHMPKMMWKAKEYNILEVNVGKRVLSESVIPVEKIHAPILILSTASFSYAQSIQNGNQYSR